MKSLCVFLVALALLAEPAFAGPNGKRKRGSRDAQRRASAGESDASPGSGSSKDSGSTSRAAAYDTILGVDGSYLSQERTYKSEGFESDPVRSTDLSVNFNYLFQVQSFYVGPLLGYSASESGSGDTKSKSDTLDVGGLLDFPFADPRREKVIPHAYVGLRYNTELSSGSDDSMSGYRFGLGGGVYYFLGRGVALNPAVEYQMQHLEGGGAVSFSADSTIFGFVLGLAAFL